MERGKGKKMDQKNRKKNNNNEGIRKDTSTTRVIRDIIENEKGTTYIKYSHFKMKRQNKLTNRTRLDKQFP